MLVRYTTAVQQIEHLDVDERYNLLFLVVCPTPPVKAASMHEAERRGVSKMAAALAARAEKQLALAIP